MTIVFKDGRALSGTALQIVQQMKGLALFGDSMSLRGYVATVVEQADRFEGVALQVTPSGDAEAAAQLVSELLRTGLASKQ